MSGCELYDPDNVFKTFKVVEFPVCFVNLSTTRYLDVKTDLDKAAYLKTMCDGTLMKFADAREISASHRAFSLAQVDSHTVQITFRPLSECINNAKSRKVTDNRFVIDLRLIRVDGVRCCNNELHSEIGRYYISGQYEYCKLSHQPKRIDFGEVIMHTQVTKYVRIKNESNLNATKIDCDRVTGFVVVPNKFVIPANSSKRIAVTIKPTSLKVNKTLVFKLRNSHQINDNGIDIIQDSITDDNFILYSITCKINVTYKKKTRDLVIESLHKLNEPDIRYTYINDADINEHSKRRKEAFKHLQICKSNYARKPMIEKFCSGRDKCYSDLSLRPHKPPKNFCKIIKEQLNSYALFNILFLPYSIDFGRIGLNTYAEQDLLVQNNTRYNIKVQFLNDKFIFYTEKRLNTYTIKLNSYCKTKINISCGSFEEGIFRGTFKCLIDNKFKRMHSYSLHVNNPKLEIRDKVLKFGMITSESFITCVPIRIYNEFNIPVEFRWDVHNFEHNSDLPFDIIPSSGLVPKHSCRICDVIYNCHLTKTKTHEVKLISKSETFTVVPIELNVITRKITMKFLQQAVLFKDIALNIETIEVLKLENTSREIASFVVMDPSMPGLKIEPMNGNIHPKTVIAFKITVKISCVLEFAFDVVVKINSKENISIPISGNVVEPKIVIQPKNIFISRIPCNMVTFVPVTFQNLGTLKTVVTVLDTGDDNMFDVYIAHGNEKQRIFQFFLEGGQSKTVFIKLMDSFRREYDLYIPFKFNGLLGPPNNNSSSTELQYYIGEYQSQYENNPKVKINNLHKNISFCQMTGVITVPWIQFSVDKFEIEYVPNGCNKIDFTMKNVSKYYLHVTILRSELLPVFTLNLQTEENESITNESNIQFELDCGKEVALSLEFHPKMHGRFVSTAILFLDKEMTIPYSNLTFIGKRQNPIMVPSTYCIIFPPNYIGTPLTRIITVKMGVVADVDDFSCISKDEPKLSLKFLETKVIEAEDEIYTILTVEIKVFSETTYARHIILTINHECGSSCEIEINFCFTYCPLTLHTKSLVKPEDNPYPYFPTSSQSKLYNYMVTCTKFLENWMFQQGFRRDLYPVIPDTFHAISNTLSSRATGTKSKGLNASYLNFLRRIAAPMMKNIHKITALGVEEPFKSVKEIHDTYKEILHLLRSRGVDLWGLQAKFLLSYDQFVIFTENVTPKSNADILLAQKLIEDVNLFNRLSKQSWIDFILQSYKVFIMDSCFFDCVCVSNEHRDVINILINWYNDQIKLQHDKLLGNSKPIKRIANLTTDLSDGVAVASALLTFCPYLADQFAMFSEVENDENRVAGIINNACLIIEALNQLRINFPVISKDFLAPNFLQMIFLSIHLYVVLPMFMPRDVIVFKPPLLRSSTRHVRICSVTQESVIFSHTILNSTRNNFIVEKCPSGENGKNVYLSVKYVANFVSEERCILLVHGYNKTRIFDTYMIFVLKGTVGVLSPVRKCKVTGPLYRPNKVDVPITSPFTVAATYSLYVTDTEPSVPVVFEDLSKPKFYLRRLHLMETEITLDAIPKETQVQNDNEPKIYLQLICLSTQVGNSWIWFRSEVGEFFVRVTTQPRWDLALETLHVKRHTWPIVDPCSCGESCVCYRTAVVMVPHRNELMVKALRIALLVHASDSMMSIFDQLIETTTGKLILCMLLEEGGTNTSDVQHILRSEVKYHISSKLLVPRPDRVTLAHHTIAMLPLTITLPPRDSSMKYTVTFTSECGMDIRTYRIIIVESSFTSG